MKDIWNATEEHLQLIVRAPRNVPFDRAQFAEGYHCLHFDVLIGFFCSIRLQALALKRATVSSSLMTLTWAGRLLLALDFASVDGSRPGATRQ